MNLNLTRKILSSHLAKGKILEMKAGDEIYLRVDHTLTHDINAVMTYLAFEAIGLDRTQVEKSVSYLDHNLLYRPSLRNTAFMFQDRVTEFVMLFMLQDSEFREN